MRVAKRYELRAARSSRCEESAPRSRPSALAVLRLMTNSNLVGPKTDGTYIVEFRTAEGESLASCSCRTRSVRNF